MKIVKTTLALLAVSAFVISCSPSSVADEDSIYDNQGIDRTTIKIPTNG